MREELVIIGGSYRACEIAAAARVSGFDRAATLAAADFNLAAVLVAKSKETPQRRKLA